MLPEDIARACGVPAANVRQNLPQILSALSQEGINTHAVRVAAIATICTEVPNFAPIPEYGNGAEYEGNASLGNLSPGDGPRYKGRGFIQLTGRANYRAYGARLGLPLEANPDLALDPHIAALVLACYFKDRGIAAMAAAGEWGNVRVAVNGGYNGWARFSACVEALERLHDQSVPEVAALTHDSVLRHFPQEDSPYIHNHDGSGQVEVVKAGTRVVLQEEETPHWRRVTAPNLYQGWVLKAILAS